MLVVIVPPSEGCDPSESSMLLGQPPPAGAACRPSAPPKVMFDEPLDAMAYGKDSLEFFDYSLVVKPITADNLCIALWGTGLVRSSSGSLAIAPNRPTRHPHQGSRVNTQHPAGSQ